MYECDHCGYYFEKPENKIIDGKEILKTCPECGCGKYEEMILNRNCYTCADFTKDWHVKHGCIGVDAKARNYDGCDHYREKKLTDDDKLKVYEEALKWIATVNAMDYEYVRVAREALGKVKEEDKDQINLFNI